QAERLRRVLDEHERHVGWRVIVERVDDQAGGNPASRVREECVAVEPVAPDREERLAHAERARVDRHPRHGDAEVTRDQRGPRRANDVLDGEQWHPSSYRDRSRRIRRATSRSSKGSTSEPTIWYVSWPLPATTTVSPASAQCSAARIARERSGSTAYRPGPAPASRTPTMISSMIPSGRSDRGLSEVTQTRSARRAAMPPMIGRFPRSRSPPQPKTTPNRLPGPLSCEAPPPWRRSPPHAPGCLRGARRSARRGRGHRPSPPLTGRHR